MKRIIEDILSQALDQIRVKIALNDVEVDIKIDRAKDSRRGDFASNVAFLLAKKVSMKPMDLAALLTAEIPAHPLIDRIEIAAPGFINFYVHHHGRSQIINQIITEGAQFGQSDVGQHQKVLIEFVSANPTGPLHVGHGRGAAFGASLANLLKVTGFDVRCEYYVNDAGRQMNILAVSVWLRYLAAAEEAVIFPANGYRGDYVVELGHALYESQGRSYVHPWYVINEGLPLDEPNGGDKEIYIDALIDRAKSLLGASGFAFFHQHALQHVLADIKDDLAEFGVHFDDWFSEQSLSDDGSIQHGIDALKHANHTYEKDGALWFKATEFGDEKDRVLMRANGQTTYFASDVAYHWNKYNRGFDRVINIFGADHHGYVTRLKAAVRALGHDDHALSVLLVQFAILYRNHERVQMSTRSGSFVTLRELREEVGNDAARFFYVIRKPEQHMDFDLDLAKSESNDNPVYYIQYAHARICSVLRQLEERSMYWDNDYGMAHLHALVEPQELTLMTLLSRYSEVLEAASEVCEPHQVAYFLKELAGELHSYYNAVTLLCEDNALRCARLCLLVAVKQVLQNGMQLLGVSAPESM